LKSWFCLKTHVANFQRCRSKALGKYPPHCAATSRRSRPAPPPGFDIVLLQLMGLSAGEHDDEMNLVVILDGFDEFIGVGTIMI